MKNLSLLLAAFLIAGLFWSVVRADDTGATSPDTTANDNSVGTVAWISHENISSSDGSDATCSSNSGTITCNYLKATNFGFAIPSDATINGILVSVERRENRAGANVVDADVKIVKADASIGTEDKADTGTEWPLSDGTATYGSSSDLWSETWTPTDINDSDFGVVLSASVTFDNPFTGQARVDHITITVYYTPAASEPTVSQSVAITNGSVQITGGSLYITN